LHCFKFYCLSGDCYGHGNCDSHCYRDSNRHSHSYSYGYPYFGADKYS
jgi:hypothetical protein